MCLKNVILYSLLLLLFSCKKEENIHIVALNPVTGEHYAGLTYYLVQQKTTSNGEENSTLKTGTLNSNGEAIFSIKLNRKHAYVIRVEEPENTCYNKSIQMYLDSPYDEDGKFTFEFAPCGYLTLSVNNVNCQGATDKIVYDLQPIYIPNYSNIIPTEKLGCYSNTFNESMIPYGNWEATWEVTRGGITTYHDSLFFINENEHFNFTINY